MYRMVATTDGERDAQPCEQFAATDKGERAHSEDSEEESAKQEIALFLSIIK